jgi:hypothetical protein
VICHNGGRTWTQGVRKQDAEDFGPQKEEVRGDLKKIHCKKLHHIYSSINNGSINVNKSRRMKLMKHLARMREMGNASLWSETLKGKDYLGYRNLEVRTINCF